MSTANFGSLLLPYNGSQCADAAYALGVQLSSDLKARLALVHIRDKPKPLTWSWAPAEVKELATEFVAIQDRLAEAIRQRLETLAEGAQQKGVEVSMTVDEGPALEAIVRRTLRPEVSAVVVGAHELADVARAVAGDTATQVVRAADKPVLTVRSAALVRPIRRLLFSACGFDVVDLRAVKFAASIATTVGVPLHILHLAEDRADYVQIDRLAIACRDEFPGLQVDVEEIDDWVAEPTSRDRGVAKAIADYGRRMNADLIVVGTAHRTGIARIVEGSIAEHLVATADCPVAVVPGYHG